MSNEDEDAAEDEFEAMQKEALAEKQQHTITQVYDYNSFLLELLFSMMKKESLLTVTMQIPILPDAPDGALLPNAPEGEIEETPEQKQKRRAEQRRLRAERQAIPAG